MDKQIPLPAFAYLLIRLSLHVVRCQASDHMQTLGYSEVNSYRSLHNSNCYMSNNSDLFLNEEPFQPQNYNKYYFFVKKSHVKKNYKPNIKLHKTYIVLRQYLSS